MSTDTETTLTKQKAPNAYKTIGEVSTLSNLPQHVLRFWELKFTEINPYKNNNRRYYSPENITLINQIKAFIYDQGYTIKGVQNLLMQTKPKTSSGVNQLNLLPDHQMLPPKKIDKPKSVNSTGDSEHIVAIIDKLTTARDKLLKFLQASGGC